MPSSLLLGDGIPSGIGKAGGNLRRPWPTSGRTVGESIGRGGVGNCPSPGLAKGLTAGGIVDGGTGGWAAHGWASTEASSKAATGILAQADRSIVSHLATSQFHGTMDKSAAPAVADCLKLSTLTVLRITSSWLIMTIIMARRRDSRKAQIIHSLLAGHVNSNGYAIIAAGSTPYSRAWMHARLCNCLAPQRGHRKARWPFGGRSASHDARSLIR